MGKQKKGILRVGTSGIVVPGTKKDFPADFQLRSRLNYYSSILGTIEINSSFYKIPMPSTFEKWSLDVPESFLFTIKLWKEVTHVKNLDIDATNIGLFLKAAERLGNKKGCLLVQFPGKISLNYFSEVEQVLQGITDYDEHGEWRIAVEFRSPTWYVGETHELLSEYSASMVLHDIPKARNSDANKAAKFVYLRFHGPKGDYRGSYDDDVLGEQFEKINAWLKTGKDVYAYFNNTMGSALENALTLKRIAER